MVEKELLTHIAEGLHQVATDSNVQGMYREDLKFFDWILANTPDLGKFLDSPFVTYKDKCASLDRLFRNLLVPEVMAFVKILVRDRMIAYFSAIRHEYDRLADEQANILEGTVFSPFPLSDATTRRLERVFSRKLGKKISLKTVIDRSLIAGIKVLLGGTIYEYSVDTMLDDIKRGLSYKNS